MTFLRRNTKTLVIVLAAVLLPALLAACPLCKDAEPSNSVAGTNMWRGMYWSILLMIAVPFSAVGGVIVAILRARRRHAASAAAVPDALSVPAPLSFPETGRART
jgi:heme/copper-type cytochrome/quinol oxidase subunit 2